MRLNSRWLYRQSYMGSSLNRRFLIAGCYCTYLLVQTWPFRNPTKIYDNDTCTRCILCPGKGHRIAPGVGLSVLFVERYGQDLNEDKTKIIPHTFLYFGASTEDEKLDGSREMPMSHNGSFGLSDPTGLFIIAMAVVGIVAAIYFALLYWRLRRKTSRQLNTAVPADSSTTVAGESAADSDIDEAKKEEFERIVNRIISDELFLQPGISAKSAGEATGKPAAFFGADFERVRGERFCDFINRLRMEKAAVLLSDYPQYTVEAVGKMCGIESRQHFHRLFSEHFNTTPSAWRRNHN